MRIRHLQKTTLLDYPRHMASIIFVEGCNFKCDYCYNKILVEGVDDPPVSPESIIETLLKRRHIIDHVVITGGEPTVHYDLIRFLKQLKENGFFVKLDTNGVKYDTISRIIDKGLVSYIAMDLKGPLGKYKQTTGSYVNPRIIRDSVDLIRHSGVDHEFRTTIWKGLYSKEDFKKTLRLVGDSKYYLQQIVHDDYEKMKKSDLPDLPSNVKLRGDWN